MSVKRNKYCVTCRYENDSKRKLDNTGGVAIWCNYKNKYINNEERQSVWCSDWVVHDSFKYDEFEDTPPNSYSSSSPDYSSSSSHTSYSESNPLKKILSGIGYGLLIILQILALPILIITFLRHPILSVGKAIRVIISAILLYFMAIVAVFIDPIMLIIWAVSFSFINTSKLVIIGYTENLYKWITSYGGFWDLD